MKKGKGKGIRKKMLLAAAGVLLLYELLVNVLISTALVPSFMRRVDEVLKIREGNFAMQEQESGLVANARLLHAMAGNWKKENPPEEAAVISADGYRLRADFFSPLPGREKPHRVAILLHGYTGEKEAMLPLAHWYAMQGYHAVTPDFRCHGESEGDFIGMGYTDMEDVLLWIEEVQKRDPEAEIVLHGLSMGASCALMLAGREELPACVRGTVADSAFTEATEMFHAKIGEWFHLPAFPILGSARRWLILRGGYDLRKASALSAVQKETIPALFIVGEKDRVIPPAMTKQLYDAASCKKEYLCVEGAGHTQGYEKDPVLYFEALSSFLEEEVFSRESL